MTGVQTCALPIYSTTGAVTQTSLSSATASGRDIASGSSLAYTPRSGLRYGWTTGLGTLTQVTRVWTTTSSWGGWSYSADRPPDRSDTRALSNSPLLEGDYLRVDTSLSQYFVLGYENKVLSEKLVREDTRKSSSGWGPWKRTKTTYTRVTEKSNKDIYSYSIKADNPVGIRFIGADAGTLAVNSYKNVIVNGSLNNPQGTVTISSRDGSIEYQSASPNVATSVSMTAKTGIGVNSTVLLDTKGTAGELNATTDSGSIRIREISGSEIGRAHV